LSFDFAKVSAFFIKPTRVRTIQGHLPDHPEGGAKHEAERTYFVVRGDKFIEAAIQPKA
jgi:hypothetical protein